jgi:parallel beta-helix repeat protein
MVRIKKAVLAFFFLSMVLGVLLCSGVVASAGIYYVDVNNGDDDNAGTAAAPWKSLHYSLTRISSGTLNVAAGTYRIAYEDQVGFEDDLPFKIEDDNITIIGEGDAAIGASDPTAVIDGRYAGIEGTWRTGIEITGSNVTIKGISIKNFSTNSGYGIDISAGTGNKVRDCKISNNTNGVQIKNSNTFKVQDCEIYENTNDGIYVKESSGEIHRNTIYLHEGSNHNGVYVLNCSPSIKRNKIYDNYTGIWVRVDQNITVSPNISNNVIYDTIGGDTIMAYGIQVRSHSSGIARPTIYHNSIYGGYIYGIFIYFVSSISTLEPVIKYNIITNFSGYGINNNGGNPDLGYNDVWHNNGSSSLFQDNYYGVEGPGDGAISEDPENGTPDAAPGPLAATSPCRDAIPIPTEDPAHPVTMDYLGYKRPQGSGFDMGAYEYVGPQTYTYTLPGGTGVAADYRIFSIPMDIGTGLDMRNTMESTLGAYDQTRWRVFAHTASGDVEMNTDAFASLDLETGMGLWGITVLTNAITFTGTLTPNAIYYEMKLAPGWHLIAVPWPNTSIQLDKIYVTDGVNQYAITDTSNTLTEKWIWDYTGGYTNTKLITDFSLAAGTGYYIKVLGSSDILLSIPPDNESSPPNNISTASLSAMGYESREAVSVTDSSEPPPLPGGPYGPVPNIKANQEGGRLEVSGGTPVAITVSLDPGDQVHKDADWWIVARTPFAAPLNWYSYVYPEGWRPGIYPCLQTPLFQVPPSFEVLDMILSTGDYIFYFAVDGNMDGEPDSTWQDTVEVKVE